MLWGIVLFKIVLVLLCPVHTRERYIYREREQRKKVWRERTERESGKRERKGEKVWRER